MRKGAKTNIVLNINLVNVDRFFQHIRAYFYIGQLLKPKFCNPRDSNSFILEKHRFSALVFPSLFF